MSEKIHIHFIEECSGKMIAQPVVYHAPRVGDEIRLSGERYYKVNRLIWCYDEPNLPRERLNVGVTLSDGE